LFANDFHFVKITTDNMEGGQDVLDELKKDRSGGLPWMTILDGDGQEIISSVGPEGNIGFPVEPFEIEHFVEMIKKASDASDEQLAAISDAMEENAKKLKGD
jgi:hypothetical protein